MTQLGNRIIENFTLAPNLELPNSPTVPAPQQNNHISRWNASNIAKEQSFPNSLVIISSAAINMEVPCNFT
jgi:hypothetical protein